MTALWRTTRLWRSSSMSTSSKNTTLCILWRTGSLCTVCNCRHNTYQMAIVRQSLSLSYLRHNISSQWHDVRLLTSRGLEALQWVELLQQTTWCLRRLFYYLFIYFVHLFFLYSWEVRLCEVAIWLAYWVLLSELSGSNHSQEFTLFLMLCFLYKTFYTTRL